jgi:Flp pilus assembly protein CpaB
LQYEIKTLLQNVLVLATGKTLQNSVPTRVNREVLGLLEAQFDVNKRKDLYSTIPDTGTSRVEEYNNVTLQLTPEDAERLLFVQSTIGDARLYLTLRNSSDQTVAKLDTTILDDVMGPDSDYGRSQIKPPPITPSRPRFYDNQGGELKPVY